MCTLTSVVRSQHAIGQTRLVYIPRTSINEYNKAFRASWCVHSVHTKDVIVGTCHRTSDGQEHKTIWRAGPERETIFHLSVTACREQGSHCHDERLAWVASWWQGTSCSSSFVSKVLGANYNRANNFIL